MQIEGNPKAADRAEARTTKPPVSLMVSQANLKKYIDKDCYRVDTKQMHRQKNLTLL